MVHKAIIAIFNYVFHNGVYPQLWSEGIINPIFKMGKMSQPDNYRKITLLSSLGKLFDSVLNNRLCFCKDALQKDGNPWQNGFKQGTQSTDNLFILNGIIEKYQALNLPVYTCFADFKSAFDYVNRHALLFKLTSRGYSGNFFRILCDLFSKAKNRVKWNMELSEMFDNVYGVLQGGIISPSLFKLYIDDMCQYLSGETGVTIGETVVNRLIFADDLVLMSETSTGLQRLIYGLETYCRRWHMRLNILKTKIMILNENTEVSRDVNMFTFEAKHIEQVDSYKYLAVIISSNKKRFKKHFDYVKEKTNRAITTANIYIRQAVCGELPLHLYLKVFDRQIRPILEYASEIWYQPLPIEVLETAQLKYLKKIIGVSQSTPTLAVLGETGRFPLHLRQEDSVIKLWGRIQQLPNSNTLSKIYRDLLRLCEQGYDTWSGRVKSIFAKYNVDDKMANKLTSADIDRFVQNFHEIWYKRYQQDWLDAINDNKKSSKLRTYRLDKTDYRIEPHKLYIRNKKHQRALTRLRVSSHKLNIELGRHSRPSIPRDERVCQFCDAREIDDEIHFLFQCKFHKEERISLLDEIKPLCPINEAPTITNMFQCIMKSKNQYVLMALAKFVHNGFQKRDHDPR